MKNMNTTFALPSNTFASFDNMFYKPVPSEQMVCEAIPVVVPLKEKTVDMERRNGTFSAHNSL